MRALIALLASWIVTVQAETASEQFRALYEREWAFRLAELPQFASSVGERAGAGALTEVTPADLRRRNQFWNDVLSQLASVDRTALDQSDRINAAIFERQIRRFVNEYESGAVLMPLNSDWGFHIEISRLPSEAVLTTSADYENYLSRLRQIPQVMAQYTDLMRSGLGKGMTIPKVVLAGRDVSIATHVVDQLEESVFYQPFLSIPETMGADRAHALREAGRDAVKNQVIPAYANFLRFFNEEYRQGARQTLAATALPGGQQYYAQQVRYYTTLDLTPKQIHEIGVSEVARIRAAMAEIIDDVGFAGEFDEFLAMLRSDPRFYAKTPRELLLHAAYISKKMDGALPRFFKTLPRQPYGVEPVPADLAPFFTVGRYVGAPVDSTRPGLYWVNTYDLPSRALYSLPALTLHEAVPGHHLQTALAQEQTGQPPFRRHAYISAYGEGWGLYSEYLGIEAGIYETPYEHFGRLTYEMWRACRLVVDTGIHAFEWNRQQAVDFMANNTALSLHEINTEVDRYISWPAQALSYKLGELKIKALRQRASTALGSNFDIREFHDLVLAQGSVPLTILEEIVERWIATATDERQ